MAQTRLVLSDASPLIGLAAAGGFGLLRRLFSSVSITVAVHDEVLLDRTRVGAPELTAALRARWIKVLRRQWDIPDLSRLGAGEASVLRAAINIGGDCLVLLDDDAARREAIRLDLTVTGTLGILIVARQHELITAVRPYFIRLAEHGFHFSKDLARTLLRGVAEE